MPTPAIFTDKAWTARYLDFLVRLNVNQQESKSQLITDTELQDWNLLSRLWFWQSWNLKNVLVIMSQPERL